MVKEAPAWHRFLPFIALAPMALVQNGSLVSLGIVVLTLIFVKTSRAPTLACWGPETGRNVLIGLAAGVAVWALSHFLMDPALDKLFGEIDVAGFAAVKGNFRGYLILLAAGFIYGGVFEEILARGFMIGWGVALMGERSAIPLLALSSIVFGLGHRYQGWAGVISTGVSGLIFGAIYLATRRKLLAPMLTHAVADAIGITCLYLGYRP